MSDDSKPNGIFIVFLISVFLLSGGTFLSFLYGHEWGASPLVAGFLFFVHYIFDQIRSVILCAVKHDS